MGWENLTETKYELCIKKEEKKRKKRNGKEKSIKTPIENLPTWRTFYRHKVGEIKSPDQSNIETYLLILELEDEKEFMNSHWVTGVKLEQEIESYSDNIVDAILIDERDKTTENNFSAESLFEKNNNPQNSIDIEQTNFMSAFNVSKIKNVLKNVKGKISQFNRFALGNKQVVDYGDN